MAKAQETFAAAGQMLALDPWLGADRRGHVGGVLATADSGPLAHRYGPPRDLVLGMTVVLSDGTVARSGGQVIKNVAGYDVAKLFCGSYGTLGLIATVNVRLHPLPHSTATAVAHAGEPGLLAGAARELACAPLELEALDLDLGSRPGAAFGPMRRGQRRVASPESRLADEPGEPDPHRGHRRRRRDLGGPAGQPAIARRGRDPGLRRPESTG